MRTKEEDVFLLPKKWNELGVEIVRADRGGSVTYHGPGQLVIYPVVSLQRQQMGVRRFVGENLEVIAKSLRSVGLSAAQASIGPAGVWVCGRKIAAVGLRIQQGVTNHGFAVNINCSLEPFGYFNPCGLTNTGVTSLQKELGSTAPVVAGFVAELVRGLIAVFGREQSSEQH